MKKIAIIIWVSAFTSVTFAQQENTDLNYKEIDAIEAVLETNLPQLEKPAETAQPVFTPQNNRQKADFSDVDSSLLYTDLAVMQKTYMPKSSRLQVATGLLTVPTDGFYLTGGLGFKASYHFSEAWGAELFSNIISSSAREELKNISDIQRAEVKSLVSLRSFSGLNLYYNFIYGKLSVWDKKLIPFEIFNTVGVGTIENSQAYKSSSLQLGVGALFSTARSSALRLDLNWAFYQTKNIKNQNSSENSIFFLLGYSWFFPEPKYR